MATPLARAQAKLKEIEHELRKRPDFRLYLLATREEDRTRMEAALLSVPSFALWNKLHKSVDSAGKRQIVPAD